MTTEARCDMIEVVIPAYNAAHFLRDTLASVAAQTHRPGRVTVVDDASSDDTAGVARACAAEFADRIAIRVIPNAGPRGPSAARNTAIRQSAADWIALLDADDLLAPGHHAALAQTLEAADDIVLGFGDSTVFRGATTLDASYLTTSGVLALPATRIAPECLTPVGGLFTALLRHGVFATSGCLFRRADALAAGLFDETMMQCEDTDLFLRLALAGRFGFTRQVVAHKRVHEENLSHARHKLAFCRGTALSLAKLEAGAWHLTSARRWAKRRGRRWTPICITPRAPGWRRIARRRRWRGAAGGRCWRPTHATSRGCCCIAGCRTVRPTARA